jgi:cysteinyl-tRNA synthetase
LPRVDRAHEPAAPLSPAGRELHDRFAAALDDDLDLPTALAVVREMARAAISADERRWLLLDADLLLGLDLDRVWDGTPESAALPTGAAELIEERAGARAAHDWARSDALREALAALGVEVVDGPEGQVVSGRSADRAGSRSGR